MGKKTAVITPLTREEVEKTCKDDQIVGIPKSGIGEAVRKSFSEKLSGQTFNFKFDDFNDIKYKIISGEEIAWTQGNSNFIAEYAQILELDTATDLFLVNHLRSGTFPLVNVTLIIDLETSLVTLIKAELGASKRPRDVERSFHFGYIVHNNIVDVRKRHEFTTDLVGKIIDWHYDYENKFVVKHLYMNNEHMAYLLLEADEKEKGLLEAAECDYIKIRKNVYIMSWLEKGHQGMQGLVLMDIDALHDIGCFFGINISNKLDSYTLAAWGKYSDIGRQII